MDNASDDDYELFMHVLSKDTLLPENWDETNLDYNREILKTIIGRENDFTNLKPIEKDIILRLQRLVKNYRVLESLRLRKTIV